MPLSEITQALVRRGVITRDAGAEAERRKKLYGGGLDTVLLELRATDEETLISHLAEIVGIPLAPTTVVHQFPILAADQAQAREKRGKWLDQLDGPAAQRLGAVPVARHDDVLDVLVRPDHDHDLLVTWAEQRSLLIEPMLHFGSSLPGLVAHHLRHPGAAALPCFARQAGRHRHRTCRGRRSRRMDSRTPTPVVAKVDPIETLLAAARLGDTSSRRSALRLLARRLADPRVIALRVGLERKAAESPPAVAIGALRSLAELRDKNAVPTLVQVLSTENEDVAAAAQAALVALTGEDCGRKPKRWLDWWSRMGMRTRVEWFA